jgi:hypothetical protein
MAQTVVTPERLSALYLQMDGLYGFEMIALLESHSPQCVTNDHFLRAGRA